MFSLVPSIRYFSPLCKMEFLGSLTPAAGKNRMNASEQKQKGRILDMAEKKAEKNEFLFDLKTPETTWKGHSKGANSDVGSMVGDMYANCYNFRIPGQNYGACLTFGYLTGKRVMEE